MDDQVRKTHVIAVGNQKGGVGKTTNTVHLAAALGERGKKCLIWDLDMNHGATLHLGVPPECAGRGWVGKVLEDRIHRICRIKGLAGLRGWKDRCALCPKDL